MRLLIVTAAAAALSFPALAQQQQQRPPQQRPPAQQQQQQQQPAPPPQQQAQPAPGMFACRTEAEVCYVGIVLGGAQVTVLFTNDPNAEGIEEKPVAAQGADLAQHAGKVVMLTGAYNKQSGLSNVQVVDVAGPLLSFAIKSMLSGGAEEEEEPEPPPPPARQPPRQQQPQQRR